MLESKTLFLTISGLCLLIVLTFSMLPFWCGLVVCFMMLWWTFYLELLVLERKAYNNEDIIFLSIY